MKLNASSVAKLKGVHPDLVRVVNRCAAGWADPATGFIVTCGVRTLEEQKVLKAKGASKTLRSRHLKAAPGTPRLTPSNQEQTYESILRHPPRVTRPARSEPGAGHRAAAQGD